MKKRLNWILIFLLIIFFIPSVLFAGANKILVIPFNLNSDRDILDLQPKIKETLEKRFEQAGAVIINSEKITPDIIAPAEARNIGLEAKADYVVSGGVIWLGDRFSIDAKLVEVFSNNEPQVFFADGQNASNFFGVIEDIGEKITIKLFKQEKVAGISVSGNKRIEAAAILNKVSSRKGDAFSKKKISADIQSIYKMGYFEDVTVKLEESDKGKKVIFNIVEKSVITAIKISGNEVYDDEEINENLSIKTGNTLNVLDLQTSIGRIEDFYKSKNYHNVKVNYKIGETQNDKTNIEFIISEGRKIRIKSIKIIGNTVYSEKKLKKFMKTDEAGFLSWLTSSGELKMQDIDQDAAVIEAFYQNNGYIFAKVGEPVVSYKEDGIYVNINISEGDRFKVGNIELTGDIIKKKELEKSIKIKKEEYFNKEILREDILLLTDIYSDKGYAYANIVPITNEDKANKTIDVKYNINKGPQVYFDRIEISGNTETRDKVIRRELEVKEKELYSGTSIKESVGNLNRLDFFENVQIDPVEGDSPDTMGLSVNVTEKPTGSFSFGGGYSSLDKLYGVASVTQRNFLGKGQEISLKINTGSSTTRYDFSFTEPWMFDIPLSGRLGLFNWETDYDSYDKVDRGVEFEFGYPIFENTRAYFSYLFEDIEISNIEDDATDSIKDMTGSNIESSVTVGLRYDSRNRRFNATSGSAHGISIQYAGVGADDIAFTKVRAKTSWYYPLFLKITGVIHGKCGYVTANSDGLLPTYERFYLGGINSLRGFYWEDLSPKAVNENGITSYKGGNKFVQLNLEAVFPIFEKAGMAGVVFFDTGNVYDDEQDIELSSLRESVGGGIRWLSPLGPIRIEYGHILDKQEGESGGRWEFTIGSAF
ncbi:MAG: outer membrane protein assembly factor BamA [Deltaproteobacteria bacterium]|nr:outer membrane protein assembly factor BamA [Deltaproteobacteria bacterium]